MESYRQRGLVDLPTTSTQTPFQANTTGKSGLGFVNYLSIRTEYDDEPEEIEYIDAGTSQKDANLSSLGPTVEQEYSTWAAGLLSEPDIDLLKFWEVSAVLLQLYLDI